MFQHSTIPLGANPNIGVLLYKKKVIPGQEGRGAIQKKAFQSRCFSDIPGASFSSVYIEVLLRRHKLYGFDNITANNGWAMAIVGATIVFLGLVVLSFVISQIHKILNLWENKDTLFARPNDSPRSGQVQTVAGPVYKERRLPSVDELISIYRPLVQQLREPFNLVQLYEISHQMDLPHPNLSINRLREANVLVALGDGTFTWNN